MDLKMEQINMKDIVDILKEAENDVAFGTVKKIKGYIKYFRKEPSIKRIVIGCAINPDPVRAFYDCG